MMAIEKLQEKVDLIFEGYFNLSVNNIKSYLFESKEGKLYKPMKKENDLFVFLEVKPKTDIILYVKKMHKKFLTVINENCVDMETKQKEVKIQIPEGCEVDEEKSTFEKIVFKKKDTKPRSWEEYERMVLKDMGYKGNSTGTINIIFPGLFVKVSDYKFLQEHTAFIKLCMLRKAWIGDWKPDWTKLDEYKYCIEGWLEQIHVHTCVYSLKPLSFPTEEMAEEFLDCFKDLLNQARGLY